MNALLIHRRSSISASRLMRHCCMRCLSSSTKKNGSGHNLRENEDGFGIVAAMTNNQVIGVDGSLPWKNLTQDWNHFVNLTRNKVLLVGRKTFGLEDPSLALLPHIRHCRACVVVSQSMNQEDLIKARVASGSEHLALELLLASSFEEALELARLEKRKRTEQSNTCNDHDDSIDCWVAGGETIYKEALRHPDAMEVQLTHVDMTVDTNQFRDVAFFPFEDVKVNDFVEVHAKTIGNCEFKVMRKI
eukprot:scaffold1237_cov104-Skeletonema_dohrnii-CCMP3373.AAC.3